MSIIFTSNEARTEFYKVIQHERQLRRKLTEQTTDCILASQVTEGKDYKDICHAMYRASQQLDKYHWLEDCTLHHVFGWPHDKPDTHRVVLISWCVNDMRDGYACEFFFREIFTPMDSHTFNDDKVRTWHKDAIPLSGDDVKQRMHGGIINHGTADKPKWSIHT